MNKSLTALLAIAAMSVSYAQVQYYLLHGISNTGELFENPTQTPFNRQQAADPFRTRLNTGGNIAPAAISFTVNTRDSIPLQASNTASQIAATNPNKAVIIGFSQGGLRGRYYTQYNNFLGTKLQGLLSISSPNLGAPLIPNLRDQGAYLDTQTLNCYGLPDMGTVGNILSVIAFFGGPRIAFNPFQPISSFMYGATGLSGYEAGLTDMEPGSATISALNNGTRMIRFGTTWLVLTGGGVSGFQKIPAHVYTGSIVGTNNNFSSISANGAGALNNPGGIPSPIRDLTSNVVTKRNILSLYNFFWVNQGRIDSCNRMINIVGNFDPWWKTNIVGSSSGDGVVPEASQYIYSGNSTSTIGGRLAFREFSNATHGGDNHILGSLDTMRRVMSYQRQAGLPESVPAR